MCVCVWLDCHVGWINFNSALLMWFIWIFVPVQVCELLKHTLYQDRKSFFDVPVDQSTSRFLLCAIFWWTIKCVSGTFSLFSLQSVLILTFVISFSICTHQYTEFQTSPFSFRICVWWYHVLTSNHLAECCSLNLWRFPILYHLSILKRRYILALLKGSLGMK